MLEHLDREFKIILNMLKVVLEKADIIHKQTGNFSRHVEKERVRENSKINISKDDG